MDSKRIRLWDLPTRLFHWSLAACVAAALISGEIGGNLMDWHARIGLLTVGLVVFRLVWGVFGSTYARFAHFWPTPAKISAYLKGEWRKPGHNPLGALSVLALLILLSVQLTTGLFANDDIAFVGPLADLIGKELSNRLTGLHHLLANVVIALVALHLVAIVFYVRIKKRNLLKPMLTGWHERHPQEQGESATGGGLSAFVLAVALAVGAVYGASGAWLPEPPPAPPAAETPSW